MTNRENFILMTVGGLTLDPVTKTPIVILKDTEYKLNLPIWIGLLEATAMATEIEGIAMARPMTHDLLKTLLAEVRCTVHSIEITELKENTYYAAINLSVSGGRQLVLDSRPSDAIALALGKHRASREWLCFHADAALMAHLRDACIQEINGLLTGSQQFGLMSGVTQSLAGRTAFIELLPFSVHELEQAGVGSPGLDAMLFTGSYPALYDRRLRPRDWFPAYVTAYVECDVRQLLKVQDLEAFQRFVRLCAGRSGQILNLSSLATDCGITHNTARAWI